MNEAIRITLPDLFNFEQCLAFLDRSPLESAHYVDHNTVYRYITLGDINWEIQVSQEENELAIQVLNNPSTEIPKEAIRLYVTSWLDLERDITPFYKLAIKDNLLYSIIERFRGLRLIGIPNLFEAFCWAILGQQINLAFAYKLKRNLILAAKREVNGHSIESLAQQSYLPFPEPEEVLSLSLDQMRSMQISRRKGEYLHTIASLIAEGQLSQQMLLHMEDPEEIHRFLIKIKGVGPWTAEYVKLKALQIPSSFPIQDAGLINAIKKLLGSSLKPSTEEIRQLAEGWKGWEGYVTIYLWHYLSIND